MFGMSVALYESFFVRFGKRFFLKSTESQPFNAHPQFTLITDSLARKEKHHVFLTSEFSPAMQPFFLQALIAHFNNEQTPLPLRETEIIYLNLDNALFLPDAQMNLEQELLALRRLLQDESKYTLFALPADLFLTTSTPDYLRAQLEGMLAHPQCRFLLLGNTAQ